MNTFENVPNTTAEQSVNIYDNHEVIVRGEKESYEVWFIVNGRTANRFPRKAGAYFTKEVAIRRANYFLTMLKNTI